MDTSFKLYESRENGLIEAKSIMNSGFFSKVHSLTCCRICHKNHKVEVDEMIKSGMALRAISKRLNWLYEDCGFYRVFPTEASLRRYKKHFYLHKDIKIKERHEEITNTYCGHLQTLHEAQKRAERIARLEDRGLATYRDTINAFKLVNLVLKKVEKEVSNMRKVEIALSGRRFERVEL